MYQLLKIATRNEINKFKFKSAVCKPNEMAAIELSRRHLLDHLLQQRRNAANFLQRGLVFNADVVHQAAAGQIAEVADRLAE